MNLNYVLNHDREHIERFTEEGLDIDTLYDAARDFFKLTDKL